MRLLNKPKIFLKKNFLTILLIIFFSALLSLNLRIETKEEDPQLLKCNFNAAKYNTALADYQQCLKEDESIGPTKLPDDKIIPKGIGWKNCGEPNKYDVAYYDNKIEYKLTKRIKLSFLGLNIYEIKKTSEKKCSDFELKN